MQLLKTYDSETIMLPFHERNYLFSFIISLSACFVYSWATVVYYAIYRHGMCQFNYLRQFHMHTCSIPTGTKATNSLLLQRIQFAYISTLFEVIPMLRRVCRNTSDANTNKDAWSCDNSLKQTDITLYEMEERESRGKDGWRKYCS